MKQQSYKALVLTEAQTTVVEQRDTQPLGENEVRVRLAAAGICGTDMHYYQDFSNAGFVLQNPIVLGHEASGTIDEIGDNVTNVAVGDKVAVTPVMNCGKCEHCRRGNANVCLNKKFPGSATTVPHIDGFFRELFEIEARCCRILAPNTPMELVAFVEPTACAMHGVERAGNVMGRKVLVTGAGPIGTLAAALAKCNGAVSVTITDLTDEPLKIAKKMGVDHCLNVLKDSLEDFVAEHGEFDVAIEASGATPAYLSCLKLVRKKGTVVQLSVLAEKEPRLPINQIMLKELDLKGSFQFNGEFERANALISSGMLDVRPMLSMQFSFEDAEEAFSLAKDRSKAMKVQFVAS